LINSVYDGCDWLATAGVESWWFWYAATVLGIAGRPGQWLAQADRAMDVARRMGSAIGFEVASYHRALANISITRSSRWSAST
jgi:hypothetical protein